jgi:hypothetical protein
MTSEIKVAPRSEYMQEEEILRARRSTVVFLEGGQVRAD